MRNETGTTDFKSFLEKSICKLAQDEYYPNVALRQEPNERVGLVRTRVVLISPCFPEGWTWNNKQCSKSLIPYRSDSENWYIASSSL